MFQAIKNQKIYEQVVEQIQEMLLDGTLKKGDRLPSERNMSEWFQVSRSSVREAIRALEIIGIVECRQGGGNYIRTSFDENVFEPLSIMFKLNNGSFNDILEYRMLFEPEMAGLAAKRITKQDTKELTVLIDRLISSDSDRLSAVTDQAIHEKIVQISRNYLLISTMKAISVIMQSFIKEARLQLEGWNTNKTELLDIHCRMCKAIIDKDSELATKESRNHFKFIIDKIQK